jgi:3-methylcrotonyl-CoA carboxylase alpha subunit
MNAVHRQQLTLHCHGEDHAVTLEHRGAGEYRVALADGEIPVGTSRASYSGNAALELDLTLEGHRQRALLVEASPGWTLFFPDRACPFHAIAPDTGEVGGAGALAGLTAPMNGRVIALLAEPGATVSAGTPLLILEAMKMEHTVKAPVDGTVDAFRFAAGDLVDGGAALVDFTPSAAA